MKRVVLCLNSEKTVQLFGDFKVGDHFVFAGSPGDSPWEPLIKMSDTTAWNVISGIKCSVQANRTASRVHSYVLQQDAPA